MYDILITFQHVPSGTTISGFLMAAPMAVTLPQAKEAVNELQERVGSGAVIHITLFTREPRTLFSAPNVREAQGIETTIPEAIIKNSLMAIQIVEVQE